MSCVRVWISCSCVNVLCMCVHFMSTCMNLMFTRVNAMFTCVNSIYTFANLILTSVNVMCTSVSLMFSCLIVLYARVWISCARFSMSCARVWISMYKGASIRFSVYFSADILQAKGEWHNVFNVLEEKKITSSKKSKTAFKKRGNDLHRFIINRNAKGNTQDEIKWQPANTKNIMLTW